MPTPSRNLIARLLTTTGAVVTLASEVAWQPDHPIAPPPPFIEQWGGEWTPSDFDTDNESPEYVTTSRFAIWHPIAQAWWEITPFVESWIEAPNEMILADPRDVLIEIRIRDALGVTELLNGSEAARLNQRYVLRKDDTLFQARTRLGFQSVGEGMKWMLYVVERQDTVTNNMLVVQDGNSSSRPRARNEHEEYKGFNWILNTYVVPGREPKETGAKQVWINGVQLEALSVKTGTMPTIGWTIGNNYYDLHSLERVDDAT